MTAGLPQKVEALSLMLERKIRQYSEPVASMRENYREKRIFCQGNLIRTLFVSLANNFGFS
jgi:hypothetical protein